MVRVGALQYTCDPTLAIGHRISNMSLHGKAIDANKQYKVAGWAPVAEGATGRPIWEIVGDYLRNKQVLGAPRLNVPQLSGVRDNAGLT